MNEPVKMFPLQTSRHAPPGPLQIPWSIAEKAYGKYAQLYGRGQSLERLAERGGFGWCEMDSLYPPWREEVDELAKLRAEVGRLTSTPIDMILHCPVCLTKHVDAPEPDKGWTNPPHKSHLCHVCGAIWRPADVPTNGVVAIKTCGENDSV